MNTNPKRSQMFEIEDAIQEILDKGISEGRLNAIGRGIKNVFDININVSIVKNTTKTFFGMTISPDVTTINKIINAIILDKSNIEAIVDIWKKAENWNLEIDSLLFSREFRDPLTAREITAVLLHEMGHIVYSSSVPVRVNNVMRYQIAKLSYQTKDLIKWDKVNALFHLPIINACATKSFSKTKGFRTEKIADAFAVELGYGQDLDFFIDKLLASFGNRHVNVSDKELEKDTEVMVTWTITNIEMLKSRKTELKKALKVQMLKTNSDVVKATISRIFEDMFKTSARDKYRGLLLEAAGLDSEEDPLEIMRSEEELDNGHDKIVSESILPFLDKIGKVKPVTRREIDMIRVDIETIETQNDKIYLLDDVYNLLDRIGIALDHIEMGKEAKVTQSKQTLEKMREELLDLKADILATRIVDKEYGVFVKYPKGYQG